MPNGYLFIVTMTINGETHQSELYTLAMLSV